MSPWNRRSVLAACAALSTTSALASAGSATEDEDPATSTAIEIGDPPGWAMGGGNAARSDYLPVDGGFPKPDTAVWRYDETGDVRVVDGTVYVKSDTELHALDAESGDLEWQIEIDQSLGPAVVDGTIYLSGEGRVTALDTADGSVQWEREFDFEEVIPSPTVAFETIYVVVDGTLYALDAADGSTRWEREEVRLRLDLGSQYEPVSTTFRPSRAVVLEDTVYVWTRGGVFETDDDSDTIETDSGIAAVDAVTGDQLWGTAPRNSIAAPTVAKTAIVGMDSSMPGYEYALDPETGDVMGDIAWVAAATPEARVSIGDYHVGVYNHETGESWSVSASMYGWQDAIVAGDTVMASYEPDGSLEHHFPHDSIVGFDLADGTEQWILEFDERPDFRAVDENTLYLSADGELVAMRASDDEPDEDADESDENGEPDDPDESDEDDGTDEDDESSPDDEGESDGTEENGDEDDDADTDADEGDDGSLDDEDGGDDGSPNDEDEIDDGSAENGDEDDEPDGSANDDDEDGTDDEDASGGTEDDQNGSSDGSDEEDSSDESDGEDEADGSGNEDEEDGSNGEDEADGEDDANDSENDSSDPGDDDSVPGFTAGASVVGGAAALEWLRRQMSVDDPDD